MYPMIVHMILPLSPSDALAARLPATLGFCGMVLATFAYARRRLPGIYALSAGFLAATFASHFGSDGRAYGLVLGFAALALLLWSLAADGRSRAVTIPLLALSIALMVASHYFAIFLAGSLFLADLVRARGRGKFDLAVSTALLAPAILVLVLHYPSSQPLDRRKCTSGLRRISQTSGAFINLY